MYLPYSKIEVRSLRRNSTGLYCRPVYISYVRFLCGNSAGNLVAARQLLASRKNFNCEWIRSNIHFLLNHERIYFASQEKASLLPQPPVQNHKSTKWNKEQPTHEW